MALPVGSRFRPTDLGLVRLYLRNMVERKQSSFITTMDLYKDEPWLLHHVSNPLFDKQVWYYFVPRSKRGGQTPNRTVPGRGGSEGGFWKSTGKKEKILDAQKRLMGFKQRLTYYQKSHHVKDGINSDWLMTEYTLDKGRQFQDLVLCHIREKKQTKDQKLGFLHHVPQPLVAETRETNNIVSNQLVQEEADFADDLEAMMLQAEDGDDTQQQEEEVRELEAMLLQREDGDDTQQQQQHQEEEIQILPPLQINDNNIDVMMMSNQEQFEWDFADELEAMMLQAEDGDDTQQQEEEEIPILPPVQSNDNNGVMMAYPELRELEAMLLQREDGDDTQQQEEDIQILPPLQISDYNIDVMMSNQEEFEWDFDFDELFDMSDLHELEEKMLQGKDRDDTQQQHLQQEEEEMPILPEQLRRGSYVF